MRYCLSYPIHNVVECRRDCTSLFVGTRRGGFTPPQPPGGFRRLGRAIYQLKTTVAAALSFPFLKTYNSKLRTENSRNNWRVRRQFRAQAPLQFLAHLHDLHSGHHDELAAQHLVRLIFIWQLARHAAILAILVPAKAPIRYRFWTDELEAPQKRIPFRDLKLLPEDRYVHQLFIRTKGFRHDESCPPRTGLRRAKSLLSSRAERGICFFASQRVSVAPTSGQ